MTAGDQSLETAQRETEEELGLKVPHEVCVHLLRQPFIPQLLPYGCTKGPLFVVCMSYLKATCIREALLSSEVKPEYAVQHLAAIGPVYGVDQHMCIQELLLSILVLLLETCVHL